MHYILKCRILQRTVARSPCKDDTGNQKHLILLRGETQNTKQTQQIAHYVHSHYLFVRGEDKTFLHSQQQKIQGEGEYGF